MEKRNKKETDDEMATVAVSFKPEGRERGREREERKGLVLSQKIMSVPISG